MRRLSEPADQTQRTRCNAAQTATLLPLARPASDCGLLDACPEDFVVLAFGPCGESPATIGRAFGSVWVDVTWRPTAPSETA